MNGSVLHGKILIVEDEKNLGVSLYEYLQDIGFNCNLAETGKQAKKLFKTFNPDVVLMDIGLPDSSGLDIAKEMRLIRKDFVLLFLSALNDPDTKVEGFEIGAEDYITKPFALKELIVRLKRSLLYKQENEEQPEMIEIGKLKIWFKRFEVEDAHGDLIPLSQKECGILKLLFEKKNQAVTREEIIDKIWGTGKFPTNRTVDNYIVKLRRWCDSDDSGAISIQNVRSVGYKLTT